MTNKSFHLFSDFADFNDSISVDDCRKLIDYPRLKRIQTATPAKDSTWKMLNEHLFAARPDVELRVFGHYWTECDLSFARLMTNVRHFSADSLMRAKRVEAIGEIPHLESLSIGIFDLQSFEVLELVPPSLTKLSLEATRSRKPSLAHLARFGSLRILYLEGQSKNIEVLSQLQNLEDVTLRSITTSDLTYLTHLPNLWSLDVKLGGIRNFRGLEGKASIKYLELWQVRELHNIDVVGALPGLQNLFLQSLPHITTFPQVRDATALRRIIIQNMKGLHDFQTLGAAPALEEFVLSEGNRQMPEQLLPLLNNPKVQRVTAYFGSKRKNDAFNRLREIHGKNAFLFPAPFDYR